MLKEYDFFLKKEGRKQLPIGKKILILQKDQN
jgi:hypothetical protein